MFRSLLEASRGRFRQRFVAPIEQRRSAPAAAALNALVRPHMLRRTKALVAAELPPKQLHLDDLRPH
ncbi:SNF2-related protein [Nocardia callitridis]|uniref:SNF2 N-terminal domain-containing protein n=1 Tax=Nocardia callitridis TaxID=648753 RepID=A0ABP9KBI7_9NOCA